jgi:hypothetical protein
MGQELLFFWGEGARDFKDLHGVVKGRLIDFEFPVTDDELRFHSNPVAA